MGRGGREGGGEMEKPNKTALQLIFTAPVYHKPITALLLPLLQLQQRGNKRESRTNVKFRRRNRLPLQVGHQSME